MFKMTFFSLALLLATSGTFSMAAQSQEMLEAEVQDLKETFVAMEMMLKAQGLPSVKIPRKECRTGRVVFNSRKGGRSGIEFIKSPFLESFIGTGKSFASARIDAMAKCDSYLKQLELSGVKATFSQRGTCEPMFDTPRIENSDCRPSNDN